MDIETSKKLIILLIIAEIIVVLISIVLHVMEIITPAISFWGIYLIILTLIFLLMLFWKIEKGVESVELVGQFSKCAIFLPIVMSFVDKFSKVPLTPEIIIPLGCLYLLSFGLIGMILTIELWRMRRVAVVKTIAASTSHNHVTKRPENN